MTVGRLRGDPLLQTPMEAGYAGEAAHILVGVAEAEDRLHSEGNRQL